VAFDAQGQAFEAGGWGPDSFHVQLRCPVAQPGGGAGAPGGVGRTGAGGGTPGKAVDRVAPVISHAKLSRTRFATRGKRRGTTFTFTLSEAARLHVAITHAAPGRRSGKACVAPRKGLKRRCTRTLTTSTLSKSLKRGAAKIAFGGGTLKLGRYTAVLTARDAAGNMSRPVRLTFTVVKA
jgi:hypothetical protein